MRKLLTFLISGLCLLNLNAQTSNRYEENKDNWPERIYDMTIGYETVNYTGKNVKAMTINGGIPGPNLEFEEGEFAVINVTNRMGVETSVQWHGMILPNYFDGVPYLTTPPIRPDFAISDNYSDHFLVNGEPEQEYPELKPGERVRLRFVNASAATFFWLTFGGEDPMLVSADGLDVVPIEHNKTLIGVAETYDYIVTVPQNGKLQIRDTAQDGSGEALAYIGTGEILKAPVVTEPDLIGSMKQMMSMGMKMGAPASKFNPSVNDYIQLMEKYKMDMGGMEMGGMVPEDKVVGDNMKTGGNPEFNYHYLRAKEPTGFENDRPIKEMLFNLTGNMNRYVWSINGVPLSETDKIKIKQGEVVRITLNNLTMMHHPMHLHGHFFRVLNENGEYSPLKHTVNVAPMQKVVMEFDASEYGDATNIRNQFT